MFCPFADITGRLVANITGPTHQACASVKPIGFDIKKRLKKKRKKKEKKKCPSIPLQFATMKL